MDPPSTNGAQTAPIEAKAQNRSDSFGQESEASQTAQDFITQQLQLEADAREALPYQFNTCTNSLGPIRQNLYSCLTCNPPPADPSEPYNSAGVCYSCSISCHGEHTLVELFSRRNFVCDCGTNRMPSTSPCSLRVNVETGTQGGVHSVESSATNTYNHNFRNRFCGCGEEYDAHQEKGTMYQCMGLATESDGGCGEDWWHPECILGLGRDWFKAAQNSKSAHTASSAMEPIKEENESTDQPQDDTDPATTPPELLRGENNNPEHDGDDAADGGHPIPPGFPAEEEFEHFICYKCTDVHPWIKRYAGTDGFLPGILSRQTESKSTLVPQLHDTTSKMMAAHTEDGVSIGAQVAGTKRKAEDDENEVGDSKRPKPSDTEPAYPESTTTCRYEKLPPAPTESISLFVRTDFRDHLCRCPDHFSLLAPHPFLLEEEEAYEPPMSSVDGSDHNHHDPNHATQNQDRLSASSRSLLDRGEAALSNMDRVRAIEGVMVYNRLRDKVKDFLKPFAESGTPVGAEDIKKYFEKLRGDDEAIRQAREGSGDGAGSSTG